jgi:hypothetical protein
MRRTATAPSAHRINTCTWSRFPRRLRHFLRGGAFHLGHSPLSQPPWLYGATEPPRSQGKGHGQKQVSRKGVPTSRTALSAFTASDQGHTHDCNRVFGSNRCPRTTRTCDRVSGASGLLAPRHHPTDGNSSVSYTPPAAAVVGISEGRRGSIPSLRQDGSDSTMIPESGRCAAMLRERLLHAPSCRSCENG